jgi:hypothetical protein
MTRETAFLVLALAGCNGSSEGPPSHDETGPLLIFDTDIAAHYTLVRSCRHPGEHSALNGFTVWVDKADETSFSAIWQTPPGVSALPPGAVVVKEIYTTETCDPGTVERWVAMKKEPGFDPTHSDWHWQEVSADHRVTTDGADDHCISCHTGNDPSCDGFGFATGRDYLCTAP